MDGRREFEEAGVHVIDVPEAAAIPVPYKGEGNGRRRPMQVRVSNVRYFL